MSSEPVEANAQRPKPVPLPPRGIAMLFLLGPGLMWCGEYIGAGEVVLTTRAGAILGIAVLWVPVVAIFAKFWIGHAGARYTVCTGEGMIDMMARTPGPKNWVIWPVFAAVALISVTASAAIANFAGIFAHHFVPWLPEKALAWIISLGVMALVWSGRFDLLKKAMAILVLFVVLGVLEVARATWPGWNEALSGLTGFEVPDIPAWAQDTEGISSSPWSEILPMLGWAAGGFASQVWYTYWVLGAGYGMAHNRSWGQSADLKTLKEVDVDTARRVKRWCRVVAMDASFALLIGIVVTVSFLMAGAGILGPAEIAPEGASVATELSRIFGEHWGPVGANLFMLAGLAAMVSTMLGHFAGWPRLLSDCLRVLFPATQKVPWKTQFRGLMLILAFTNLVVVYSFGFSPVGLAKVPAVIGGLVLTPLQALSVGLTFYIVMPRMFRAEVWRILRPNPVYAAGLALAFVMFTYFCIAQLPGIIFPG